MHINYWLPGSWQELNEKVEKDLQLDPKKTTARVYLGLNHALTEITQSLAKQFPHKKKVFYIKNIDPYLESPMVELSKDGLNVNALSLEDLEEPQSFIEQLDNDTLMLLQSTDDPLLGQKYSSEKITSGLSEKRLFHIKVSHSDFRYGELDLSQKSYEIRILVLAPDLVVALFGSKAKHCPMVAEGLKWDPQISQRVQEGLQRFDSAEDKIEKFEASESGGFKAHFTTGASRVGDRSVIFWEDMDGYAFIHELSKELGFSLSEPGDRGPLETPSLSRWGGVKTVDWLKSQGLSDSHIRGLVLISHELLNDEFNEKVKTVRERVLKKQNG